MNDFSVNFKTLVLLGLKLNTPTKDCSNQTKSRAVRNEAASLMLSGLSAESLVLFDVHDFFMEASVDSTAFGFASHNLAPIVTAFGPCWSLRPQFCKRSEVRSGHIVLKVLVLLNLS